MGHSSKAQQSGGAADSQRYLVQWVEKAKAGNRIAFERLMELYQENIFRMVYYRTRSKMDAEDITQEIFVKAFHGLAGLKENGRFKSWLFSIASNSVRDFHRKKRFQVLFSVPLGHDTEQQIQAGSEQDPDVLEDIMRQDFWNHVDSFLDKLSKTEREVFVFRFMDDLRFKEIAQVMKKSESTVKTLLYRGLKKFRNEPSMIRFLKEARI